MPVRVEEQDFYTVREACALLGIKPATLYAYVSRGIVTSYRQGIKRQRLYAKDEIDAMLSVSRAGKAPSTPQDEPRIGKPEDIPLAETWIGYT